MASFSVNTIKSKFYTYKPFLIIVFLWICYSEYITYWTLPSSWFEPPDCSSPDCKKILLVSDPQIIGREWKGLIFVDFFAMWDCDRYLRRTFRSAIDHIQPDIIVFLGDLTDQGHSATDTEFLGYVRRFKNIFELPVSFKDTKVIIAPGDNDVGGVDDVLIPAHVERFDIMFNQSEESTLNDFIEFCKINIMKTTLQNSRVINNDFVRVGLTHVPLLREQNSFVKEVVKRIRPHVIFSGHLHTSFHYAAYETDVWSYKHMQFQRQFKQPKMYRFHEGLIHEIVVPTCSYRMGQYDMGFGVVYIDGKKKRFQYGILWLPHRFLQLFIHLIILSPVALTLLLRFFKKIRRYLNRRRISPDKLYSSFP